VVHFLRKAAENGVDEACWRLAHYMYMDKPYAREVGHVGEAAGTATSAGVMEGHDVPSDVLTGVVHWLWKGSLYPNHSRVTAAPTTDAALNGHPDVCVTVCVPARPPPALEATRGWVEPGRYQARPYPSHTVTLVTKSAACASACSASAALHKPAHRRPTAACSPAVALPTPADCKLENLNSRP
jgi:hypothetical protein